MNIEDIRRQYDAQPFQPFTIHTASGRQFPVPHREFMLISPTGRSLVVAEPNGGFNIIAIGMVSELEVKE